MPRLLHLEVSGGLQSLRSPDLDRSGMRIRGKLERPIQAGSDPAQTAPKSYMTWVNNRPFPAAFYFRDIRSASVDLKFKVEGNEPILIHHLTAHAHPDAIYRLFENGLVLANPSAEPYVFDLQTVAPDRKFSRIQGSPTQDPKTNSGRPIGESVTLDPLDSLFLRVDHQAHSGP